MYVRRVRSVHCRGGRRRRKRRRQNSEDAVFFFEGSAREGGGGGGRGRFMIVESDIGREILGFIAFSEEQKENF